MHNMFTMHASSADISTKARLARSTTGEDPVAEIQNSSQATSKFLPLTGSASTP
jgi:hypothetical protein